MKPEIKLKDVTAVLITLAVLAIVVMNRDTGNSPQQAGYQATQPQSPAAETPSSAPLSIPQATATMIGSVYATIVTYTDSGFLPRTVTIPKSGAVIFKNSSSKMVRVASGSHPEHDGYPDKNGCVGSAFDSCSGIPPGVSWSFIFDYSGAWSYHDHFNPAEDGTVIVQ